jgi:hypothetical protein
MANYIELLEAYDKLEVKCAQMERDRALMIANLWRCAPGWHCGDPCFFCGAPSDKLNIGPCPGTLLPKGPPYYLELVEVPEAAAAD